MAEAPKPTRTRVERGIYRQPNGRYAVCARRAGRLHFRTAATIYSPPGGLVRS